MSPRPPPRALDEARDTLTLSDTPFGQLFSSGRVGVLLAAALLSSAGAQAVALAFCLAALRWVELLERPARRARLGALQLSWDAPALALRRGGRAAVTLSLHNPTAAHLEGLRVSLRGPDGALLPRALCLAPGARAALTYSLEGRWVGDWGLWGVEVEWSPGLALSALRLQRPLPLSASVDF
ncbi:MAG: hypothetical protein FJ138_08900, partial [Deltaproteobacteria bacterium]|nr:hypothetical protein [Deltaproteobacteria bacterium]